MSEALENQDTPAAETPIEATAPVNETPATDAPPAEQPQAPDYSFVPAKFLREGQPDFELLAKSYVNLEKKIGQKGAFAPETIDEYQFTPTSIELDEETSNAFKTEAKEQGISAKQYEWMMSKYEQAYTQTTETPQTAQATLKELWGDQYEANARLAAKAMDYYIPSNIPIEAVGNNPYVVAILARIGQEMQEDSTPSNAASGPVTTSHEEVKQMMADPRYRSDKKFRAQVDAWYEKNIK